MKSSILKNTNTLILLLPWLITLIVFWLYPLGFAVFMSFTKYQTLTNSFQYIGFENYLNIFKDEIFWKALFNTSFFTLGTVPVTTLSSLILASILNSKVVKFKELFRASYFLPSVTSLVVISLIFTNLYTKDGYVNSLLIMLGLAPSDLGFLQNPSTSLLAIMFMDVWISIGYYVVLFLAGMQTIPQDLYDAAKLSGASPVQQFFRVTIPMLRPTLLFVIVINTIKSFQIFVEIFVMTKGGPLNSTMTLVYQVYINAFEKTDTMGYASALALLVFLFLIVFSLLQMKLLRWNR
ncbi:MAG TPA: sugar ABC transporter permease [Candidatus Kapabacteria bacterium]|nr:sugar ABC transporter permease [Candidatus Kapabacteria bacterium]